MVKDTLEHDHSLSKVSVPPSHLLATPSSDGTGWSDLPDLSHEISSAEAQDRFRSSFPCLTAWLSSALLPKPSFASLKVKGCHNSVSSTGLCPRLCPPPLAGSQPGRCPRPSSLPSKAVTLIRKAECSQKVPLGQLISCKSLLICYICFWRAERRFFCSGAGTKLSPQWVQRVSGHCDQAPRSWVCRIFAYYRRNWKNLEFTSDQPLTSWTTVFPPSFCFCFNHCITSAI